MATVSDLGSVDPQQLLETVTRRILDTEHSTKSITRKLVSGKATYGNVSCSLRTGEVKDDKVSVFLALEFESELEEIFLGVTKAAEHTAALASCHPELFDVVTNPSDLGIDSLPDSLSLRLKLLSDDDSEPEVLSFIPLRTEDQLVAFPAPPRMTTDDFVILWADGLAPTSRQRYRAEYELSINFDERFVYWYADRPMFLRDLDVDARTVAEATGRPVQFKLFIGDAGMAMLEARDSRLSATLNSWIFDGNGVVAVW